MTLALPVGGLLARRQIVRILPLFLWPDPYVHIFPILLYAEDVHRDIRKREQRAVDKKPSYRTNRIDILLLLSLLYEHCFLFALNRCFWTRRCEKHLLAASLMVQRGDLLIWEFFIFKADIEYLSVDKNGFRVTEFFTKITEYLMASDCKIIKTFNKRIYIDFV